MEISSAAGAGAGAASLHDWPLHLVQLLIAKLARGMFPPLRLVSKAFATCIAPSIDCLNIKVWLNLVHQQQTIIPGRPNGAAEGPSHQRLLFVSRVEIVTPEMQLEHWSQLQHIINQLPQLQHLRIHSRMATSTALASHGITAACAAALSGLTRLDMPGAVFNINVPQLVQLPALRAASFGVVLGTSRLAAFAPHLQQLYCDHLQLECQQQGPCRAAMPSLTHLGANRVFGHGTSHFQHGTTAATVATAADADTSVVTRAAAAAAAAAASTDSIADASWSPPFPNLRVLSKLPQGVTFSNYDAVCALAGLSAVTAIRGVGRFRDTQVWQQLAQQQQLQLLDLHDEYGVSAFQGVSQLRQLRALRLTGSCAGENASLVLQQICQLPSLRAVALPAELLCKRCCPDVHASRALQAVCGRSGLVQLLFVQLQPGSDCPHADAVQEGLVLLQTAAAWRSGGGGGGGGSYTAESDAGDSSRFVAKQQQQQQQQQQLHVHVRIEQNVIEEPAWKCTSQGSDHIWGVYGCSSGLLLGHPSP